MDSDHILNPAHALERAWLRDRALDTDHLDADAHAIIDLYQFALRLASSNSVQIDNSFIDCTHALDPFRQALFGLMRQIAHSPWSFPGTDEQHGVGTLAWSGSWLFDDLVAAKSKVSVLLHNAFSTLHTLSARITPALLEPFLAQKKLVLALGGGGGTGYVHLCLFQWLQELGIKPSLITGTSFGALLGCIRAMQDDYCHDQTMHALPGLWQITKHLRPCLNTGHHGLMGMFRLELDLLIDQVAKNLGWNTTPNYDQLKIPFASVSSGILMQPGIETLLEERNKSILAPILNLLHLNWRHAVAHATHIASVLTSQNAIIPVVFGFDNLTKSMACAQGSAFSTLIPGVLNFEVAKHKYKSRDILDTLFLRDRLYRLCDGGLASNVPVRAARNEVLKHRIGHENIYLLGIDVFAPQPTDLFYPLEQIANSNAVIDATYADAFVRLKYLLSPVNITPTGSQFKWLNDQFRQSFLPEMDIIRFAMTPLRPLQSLGFDA